MRLVFNMQKTSPEPTFCNRGNHKHVRMMHHPGTHQILKHSVEHQHHELSILTPTHRSWWIPSDTNHHVEAPSWKETPMVSVVWSNLLSLSSRRADWKHLDFSLQKGDCGESLKANHISQGFQWTEDLESIQARSAKCLLSTHSSPVK